MPNTDRPRVVFDASPLRYLHTGLGQFVYYLIRAFEQIETERADLRYLVHPSSKHLVGDVTDKFVIAGAIRRHMPSFLFPFLFGKYDVWHVSAENTHFKTFSKSSKVLLTLHGLHFLDEDNAEVAKKKLAKVQEMVNRADAIATVSTFTADLVRRHLDVGPKPIRVIPHGIEKDSNRKLTRPDGVPDSGIIFSIGNFFERKNFHVLIPFLKDLDDYTLVMAGNNQNPYGERVKKDIERLGLSSRVVLLGEVSEPEKYWLYENCSAFVFPSVSEGFGIPVIEALQAGKPVFCSTFGSLPEVGSTHAFYWDNFEPEYMKNLFVEKMRLYHSDAQNASNSMAYAATFSWTNAARLYLDFYVELTK